VIGYHWTLVIVCGIALSSLLRKSESKVILEFKASHVPNVWVLLLFRILCELLIPSEYVIVVWFSLSGYFILSRGANRAELARHPHGIVPRAPGPLFPGHARVGANAAHGPAGPGR